MFDVPTVTLVLTLVVMSAGGVWQLSRVETSLRKDITRSRDEIEVHYGQEVQRLEAKQEQDVRNFCVTIAAIRQKGHEIELFAANTFMRRESFYKMQEELKAYIKAIGDKIDQRLDRMEEKIDGKR